MAKSREKFHRKRVTMQEQINNLWIEYLFAKDLLQTQGLKDRNVAKNVSDRCAWRRGYRSREGEGDISREMKMKNTVCGFFAVKNERTSVGSINLIECSWIMGGTVKNNSAVKEQPGWTRRATLTSLSLLDEYGDGIEPTRVIFIPFIMLLIRNRDGIADNRCTVTGMSVNFSGIFFRRPFVIH